MRCWVSAVLVCLPAAGWAQISFDASSTTGGGMRPGFASTCTAAEKGTIRSSNGVLAVCDGSAWGTVAIGGGVPAGVIVAVASTTCPVGWSEYTAARGRFLRGIDNGAGNDPGGTRAPGNAQADDFKSHTHSIQNTGPNNGYTGFDSDGTGVGFQVGDTWYHSGIAILATGGAETRPKNVAVLFCRKD